jgi:hypothetical protein
MLLRPFSPFIHILVGFNNTVGRQGDSKTKTQKFQNFLNVFSKFTLNLVEN